MLNSCDYCTLLDWQKFCQTSRCTAPPFKLGVLCNKWKWSKYIIQRKLNELSLYCKFRNFLVSFILSLWFCSICKHDTCSNYWDFKQSCIQIIKSKFIFLRNLLHCNVGKTSQKFTVIMVTDAYSMVCYHSNRH